MKEKRRACSKYPVFSLDERPELIDGGKRITNAAWPEFMQHDVVSRRHWNDLYHAYPEFQFALTESDTDQVIAVGNSLPLMWNGSLHDLPDEGWDWALARGFDDQMYGRIANMQCALSIVVAQEYRGKSISTEMVKQMKSIGADHGLKTLVAPIRPSLKKCYPLMSMEHYINWRLDSGSTFDPWMRVHARLGAAIIKVCNHSMRIVGSIADWERWTGIQFPESGKYIVPEALNPVEIDIAIDQGSYVEPNVWMCHSL
jgi:hypothetical protein